MLCKKHSKILADATSDSNNERTMVYDRFRQEDMESSGYEGESEKESNCGTIFSETESLYGSCSFSISKSDEHASDQSEDFL